MNKSSSPTSIAEQICSYVRERFETTEFVPLHVPSLSHLEKERVVDAIDSTFVSTVGEYVNVIERKLCEITGSPYAIATVNGTAALQVALRLAGVETGTEVILPPLSFVATANAVSYLHAHPLFVDVESETLGLSVDALTDFFEQKTQIQSNVCVNRETGRRISACVPMHTFGFPVNIEAMIDLCNRYCVPVVEDAAESLGSKVGSRHAGTFGKLAAVSFNGNKIVTAGGGGAILTADEQLAKHAKHLTTTAKTPHPWDYFHDECGYNYRMPNLNAALLSAQLDRLDDFLSAKRQLAAGYQKVCHTSDAKFLWERPGTTANFWLMTLRLESRDARDKFLEHTNEAGVMTRPAWRLLNELPMYDSCQCEAIPSASQLADQLVNVPSSAIGC